MNVEPNVGIRRVRNSVMALMSKASSSRIREKVVQLAKSADIIASQVLRISVQSGNISTSSSSANLNRIGIACFRMARVVVVAFCQVTGAFPSSRQVYFRRIGVARADTDSAKAVIRCIS